MTSDLFEPLHFTHGAPMKNRFMLAPMTNLQSHDDGTLSDDEFRWLTMRAEGGIGLTITCATHVQPQGKGFPGQLGIFSDDHIDGLSRLARKIREEESLGMVQLHHAGMRSPRGLIGQPPVCPSENDETGARAPATGEVEALIEDFIAAAERAQHAGFVGVEIHGAHGYILCQFLSPTINRRHDRYGGSPENRSRIIFDIIKGIRARCRPDFTLGLRLSPERFEVELAEIQQLVRQLMAQGSIDYLDMSLWDVFKEPVEIEFQGRALLSYFTELDRANVRLGVAGKVGATAEAKRCLELGVDFVLIGRAAILHHDFPLRVRANADFRSSENPVSAEYLRGQGLGEAFVEYMKGWEGFVEG